MMLIDVYDDSIYDDDIKIGVDYNYLNYCL